jgi:hypothetical protein
MQANDVLTSMRVVLLLMLAVLQCVLQALKINVDMLKLIQLGLTFTNAGGFNAEAAAAANAQHQKGRSCSCQ